MEKTKECMKCNHFKNLDDAAATLSYGFCRERKVLVYKNDMEGCKFLGLRKIINLNKAAREGTFSNKA